MKYENEITVKVNIPKDELITTLLKKGFIKTDNYKLNDLYMVKQDCDLTRNPLDILKNSVLVRSIDDKHYFVYKYKEYDENENITKQGKTQVEVVSRQDGIDFLTSTGYKELIKIIDLIEVYEKDGLELCIEAVNDKHLYIEIEGNEKYDSIQKLIEGLDSVGIPYDKGSYFVKKAKIIFEEEYCNK